MHCIRQYAVNEHLLLVACCFQSFSTCNKSTYFPQAKRVVVMSMTTLSTAVLLVTMMLLRHTHGQGKLNQRVYMLTEILENLGRQYWQCQSILLLMKKT